MAHVERRKLPDGLRYRARYRDPTGKEHVKTFRRKTDADNYLAVIEADKARGQWLDPRAGKVTFAEYAAQWQAAQLHRPGTQASVESCLRLHLLPAFGPRPVASIRPTEVRQFVRGLSERLAPSTVALHHRWLSVILNAAVSDGIIHRNPATGTGPGRPDRRAVEPLRTEQVRALIDAAPDRYRALFLLALGTGMRQAECFGVALAAPGRPGLDLLRRRVDVAQQVVQVDGRSQVTRTLKTAASRRTVPLAGWLAQEIAEHLARFPARDDGVIFSTPSGRLLRRSNFGSEVWRPACRRAGLPDAVTFHWLRHQFASLMLGGGASLLEVQRMLGHASIKETADVYGHLLPDAEELTRQRIEQAFGPALRAAL